MRAHSRSRFIAPATLSPSGAFTLIELMIVIVIIGILAGIAIPAFNKMVANGKAKTALAAANQLKIGIGNYFTEYRRYPIRNPEPDDGNRPILSGHGLMDVLLPSEKEGSQGGLTPRRKGFVTYNSTTS